MEGGREKRGEREEGGIGERERGGREGEREITKTLFCSPTKLVFHDPFQV